jgi:hypothetical protein
VIANTQPVDAAELARAINLEWTHRGLPGTPAFNPPATWASGYVGLARSTPGCANHPTFDAAVHFVREEFLGPALSGEIDNGTWEPARRSWR